MQSSRVSVDQVEQWEEVDPDNVDKMPIQAADLDRRIVLGRKSALPRHGKQPGKNSETNNHVQRVNAGHHEVKGEKNLSVAGISVLPGVSGNRHMFKAKGSAGDVMFFELILVFFSLDAEKSEAQQHSDAEHGVDRLAGRSEISKVPVAVNQIRAEHAAKKHHLGGQKNPHAQAGGVALLFRFGEMMQEFRMVLFFLMKTHNCAAIGQREPPAASAAYPVLRSYKPPRLRLAPGRS